MALAKMALLEDRGVVRVTGADAEALLQGIVTNEMGLLAGQPAIHAALLTPQGKILFEFFVGKADSGFLLETAREQAATLVQRLTMYKLRAKVTIEDASREFAVAACWNGAPLPELPRQAVLAFEDPRLAALGTRALIDVRHSADAESGQFEQASPEDYHAHRIALGVPEGGKDYRLGDTFPHEANLDQLHGISFSKGCFVGQEVVSRMQHRATVRKRVMPVEGEAPLQSGTEITTGSASIGVIGSVSGTRGLALVRLDRAAEAAAKGEPLTTGNIVVRVRRPDWATFDMPISARVEAP